MILRSFEMTEFGTDYKEPTMDQELPTTMDHELLNVLRRGDEHQIRLIAGRMQNIFSTMSPRGNTVLHMAIRFRNHKVIPEILRRQDSLLRKNNWKGETPLHIAARVGDPTIVSTILKYVPAITNGTESEPESLLRITDDEGNTPLHNAVRIKHENVVRMLVKKDRIPLGYLNNAEQTPLSIAIDSSLTDIAFFIIDQRPESLNHRLPEELTLLHSAVMRQNYEIMVKILDKNKGLINLPDWHQRSPLHYAAALGNVRMAKRLLEENNELAYKRDRYFETPLHLAAENGKLNILKELIDGYPDAIEILNKKDRSILHLAAENGNMNIVSFILKSPEMEDLINSADEDGNTPLHLAAMNFHSDVVHILCKHKSVNIRAKNHSENRNTALAIVESSKAEGRDIQKHLTIKALRAAYAKRALYPEDIRENRRFYKDEGEKGKEMAQTLSVMATLIATFTFTAAFTIPGGFKSDDPDAGMATLLGRASFQAFVITDAIAMTSAMTAAVTVFWSFWKGKSESFMDALPLAIGFTWIALISMTLAFVTGLYVVLSNNLALAILVCVIGCFLPFVFYVFAPFFMIIFDQTEVNPFAFVVRFVRNTF
ncbi:hypothetical protein AB3S75_020150 [Citrus x aurantiifolia]